MSQPPLGDVPAARLRFLTIPPEMRLKIYEFVFSDILLRLPVTSRTIEYHFCEKTFEVTTDLGRCRAQRRTPSLTPILRTCRLVYREAEPVLYDQFRFIARLRPNSNPLNLSRDVSDRLAKASTLELHISNDTHRCQVLPRRPWDDPPRARDRTRRGSWDGGSSLVWVDARNHPRWASKRGRRPSWSGPATEYTMATRYAERLGALLDALDHGKNLKHLDIFISDSSENFDARHIEGILRHIEARLRVRLKCAVTMQVDRFVERLVSHVRIATCLFEIQ